MFWLKLRQCKVSMLPQFLTSCRQIWQVHKNNSSRCKSTWGILKFRSNYFYDSIRVVLYAANREFSSNACKKLMTRTIKNPQHGIRAQMVLKLTKKLKMVETETDSPIDV